MTSELKAICRNLDDVLSEFFGVTQEILECQNELNSVIADGHILMAKARYSMGNKAVGQLQYDENQMEQGAKLHVLVDDNEFFLKSNASKRDLKSNREASVVTKRNISRSAEDTTYEAMTGIQDISISEERDRKESGSIKTNPVDPIKWFGVLVPQSLRQCQAKFKRAAEISCKIASLKVKYGHLQNEFRKLKSEKWHLLNDAPEL